MSKGEFLGEFEQIVLLAVARLGDEAYGMTIRREIESRTGRTVSIGAAYATLDRLASKQFVQMRDAAGDPDRRGRARRYFTITLEGVRTLELSRAAQNRMWAGLRLSRAARKS